jgi:hypothetical protein
MLMPTHNPLPLPIEAERVTDAPRNVPTGPSFQVIEETTWEALEASGRQLPFERPVLVKGGVKHWPAFSKWSFEHLASVCESKGAEAPVKFTDGLVEQGVTKGRPFLPVAPYLRELGKQALATPDPAAGLLPKARLEQLRRQPGERFHLNWAHMQSFKPTTLYLAQWDALETFPELRNDLMIKSLWPGQRLTWEYVFMGPANTVTGPAQRLSAQLVLPAQGHQGVHPLSARPAPAHVPRQKIRLGRHAQRHQCLTPARTGERTRLV